MVSPPLQPDVRESDTCRELALTSARDLSGAAYNPLWLNFSVAMIVVLGAPRPPLTQMPYLGTQFARPNWRNSYDSDRETRRTRRIRALWSIKRFAC